MQINTDENNTSDFSFCDVAVTLVQGGSLFDLNSFDIIDDATNQHFCVSLAPGVVADGTLTVKPGIPLNLRQAFDVFYSGVRIISFP